MMAKLILKTLVLLILVISGKGFAQSNIDTNIVHKYDSIQQSYIFKPNLHISINDLVTIRKAIFNLNNNSSLVEIEEMKDPVHNGKFYRFNQHFNSIPIESTMLNVFYDSLQNPISANGNLFSLININTSPTISGSQAVDLAINSIPEERYYWQDSTMEADIKEQNNDDSATYYPKGQLVILPVNSNSAISYNLCYKVRMSVLVPHDVIDLFVDASTGAIIHKMQIAASCAHNIGRPIKDPTCLDHQPSVSYNSNLAGCSATSCNPASAYMHPPYNLETIYTDKFPYGILQNCKYRLKDNCTGTTLYTKKNTPTSISDIRDDDNSWTSNDQEDLDGMTAHWSLERTHDYFRYRFGRNGWNGNFQQANVYTNWDVNGVLFPGGTTQALFNGGAIIVSKKIGWQYPIVFLDGIGHEFTHGITKNTSNLNLQGESGALNEGFSDVFATMIEWYYWQNFTVASANYLIFELSDVTNGGVRDMAWPKNFSNPDTYNGTYWASTVGNTSQNDYGGIHTNNGVLNYWFYLLAEGGSGTNDNGDAYCVKAIGRDKASDIAWRTLTMKLSQGSQFSNCRFFSIESAEDLFGLNSFEAAQVTQAWYAVGVGPQYNGQINIQNVTLNNLYNLHVNSPVNISNSTFNLGTGLSVTSNTEIQLTNFINMNNGVYAELYITPQCTGAARMGNTNSNDTNRITNEHSTINNFSSKNKKSIGSEISNVDIMPNPNDGIFKLTLNNVIELPIKIIIRDVFGRDLRSVENPTLLEYDFNLEKESPGIYMINVYYDNKVISKRIIKN